MRVGVVARIRRLGTVPAVIIFARVTTSAFLVALWFLWARTIPQVSRMSGLGTAVWTTWSIILSVLLWVKPDRDLHPLLTVSAFADAVALGLLTAALGQYENPFLAWYVIDAASFAVLLRKRRGWLLMSALVISYIMAHVLGHAIHDPVMYVFLVVQTTGLLAVGIAVSYTLGDQEQRNIELEAARTGILQANERLERSVNELRAVTEITELIHSTLEVESVGPVLLDILEKVLNIPTASLYVIDKAKQETLFSTSSARPVATRGYSGYEIAGTSPSGEIAGALSCIELIDHDKTAVVFCADESAIDSLSNDDRVVLQAVASELVVAVENSRLYRLTKRLAITDELTDLYNYRYLQQRLDDEVHRAERYGKRLSFLMLDVDDFKRVNDTHGHRVGDEVLSEIGHLLKSTVREVDIVARYGGEEFSVILPETDAPGAFIVAEKIREAVSLKRFEDEEGQPAVHVTVSIGLASFPSHATDKESLLRAADDAVYHAKETGKDRVRAPRLRMRRIAHEGPPLERIAE